MNLDLWLAWKDGRMEGKVRSVGRRSGEVVADAMRVDRTL
jgi:hypothetical protein